MALKAWRLGSTIWTCESVHTKHLDTNSTSLFPLPLAMEIWNSNLVYEVSQLRGGRFNERHSLTSLLDRHGITPLPTAGTPARYTFKQA